MDMTRSKLKIRHELPILPTPMKVCTSIIWQHAYLHQKLEFSFEAYRENIKVIGWQ
jgi:hypothetical protein